MAVFLAIALPGQALAHTGELRLSTVAGLYRIVVVTSPTPVTTAGAYVTVMLADDARDELIRDARITVSVDMPGMTMGGPPRPMVALPEPDEPGYYTVYVPFGMDGLWRVHVSVAGAFGENTVFFDLPVEKPTTNWSALLVVFMGAPLLLVLARRTLRVRTQTPSGSPIDLLRLNSLRRFLLGRWYPASLQLVSLVFFGAAILVALLGVRSTHGNWGSILVWVIWWPLLPLTFFFFGRLWCALCPFPFLTDKLRRLVGLQRPVPVFLRKYGIWIIDATFILITWGDHVFGVVNSPRVTGYLLLATLSVALLTALIYERRAFCRYLCFLGGLSGNYSMSAWLELRASPNICRQSCKGRFCYEGDERVEGCPMFEYPRSLTSNRNCNLCAQCIKSCPYGAISLRSRWPLKELWQIKRPRPEVSFLAVVLIGVVIIQNVTMLNVWPPFLSWFQDLLGFSNYGVAFTLVFAGAMALPAAALGLTSLVSSRFAGETFLLNFSRTAYALIPVDLAGHVAHNLFHLSTEGGLALNLPLQWVGLAPAVGPAILDAATIQVVQYALLTVGTAGSLFTAYQQSNVASRRTLGALWPHIILILGLAAVNLWLFALPMFHRA